MSIGEKRTKYESVQYHWTQILATFRFIVTQFVDEFIEIVARIVMLAAPFPNAVSLWSTTSTQLKWAWYQSLPFALTIELIVFFLIEVALLLLNQWLEERRREWLIAFGIMTGVAVGATGVVIHLVRELEPHQVMAWLPVLSLCSFVAIGLKRWVVRHQETVKPVKRIRVTQPKRESKTESPVNQLDAETESILNHYRFNPMHSQRQTADALGLNQSKVNRSLKQLKALNRIHVNGNGVEVL